MHVKHHQIAVIIINYNSADYTLGCVKSIREQTHPSIDYEIVVVDNNSVVGDVQKLAPLKELAEVKLVYSRLNLGFSGGNMYGVLHTSADYYYFLNNDCLLMNDCLSILWHFCEQHPDVGLCSGQMFSGQGEPQQTFSYMPSPVVEILGKGMARLLGPVNNRMKNRWNGNEPFEVDMISGSSMFVKGSLLAELGGLDTTYFLYCEEEDLALRAGRAGYRVYMVPQAKYIHFGGGSTTFNLTIEKEFYISFLYFFRKNYGRWSSRLMQAFLFFKLGKKIFRNQKYGHLVLFVLRGAHLKNSLRHRQKINEAYCHP